MSRTNKWDEMLSVMASNQASLKTFVEALQEMHAVKQEGRRLLADRALFEPKLRSEACVAWGECAMLSTLIHDAEAYIKR